MILFDTKLWVISMTSYHKKPNFIKTHNLKIVMYKRFPNNCNFLEIIKQIYN